MSRCLPLNGRWGIASTPSRPFGPAIVTKDEIPDPHSLYVKLSIGGDLLQHSNTRELIFKIPDLIAYISSITPLQPGDIISTGTPSGVELGRTPHRQLRPSETIITEIEGIGQLTGDRRGVTTLRSGLLTSQLYLRRGSPVS